MKFFHRYLSLIAICKLDRACTIVVLQIRNPEFTEIISTLVWELSDRATQVHSYFYLLSLGNRQCCSGQNLRMVKIQVEFGSQIEYSDFFPIFSDSIKFLGIDQSTH